MNDLNDLVKPFLSATHNVLKTMASTEITAGNPLAEIHASSFGTISGVIGMANSSVSGNMVLSFDEPSILAIVNRMLMEEHIKIDQDVIDAVGEITNMICGGAKKELAEHGHTFDMATPMVFRGSNLYLQTTPGSNNTMIPFSTPEGKFILKTDWETKT